MEVLGGVLVFIFRDYVIIFYFKTMHYICINIIGKFFPFCSTAKILDFQYLCSSLINFCNVVVGKFKFTYKNQVISKI